MERLHALVERVRREAAPDARSDILEVLVEARGGAVALVGATTLPHAAERLLAEAATLHRPSHVHDEIVRLPDPRLGEERVGLVRAATAPLYAQPVVPAPQISQLVTGMRVDVLARRDPWLRVRGEDGYIGWVHGGYLLTGDATWAAAWLAGLAHGGAVSLGAELVGQDGRLLARLPWGARVVRHDDWLVLPDGRRGRAIAGEVVEAAALPHRFPAEGAALVATARRWLGVPYLWGGIAFGGADCSGFVQAVLRMHGIVLPRDSDMQALAGAGVPLHDGFAALRPADLLFFAEGGSRVSHVALSLGGSCIVHAAIGNGGVAIDDLTHDAPLPRRLRETLVSVRRLIPD